MIRKILIANRGEIAVRIIRTCKEMGIETVAIYSTADKDALHVQLASEAVCVGSPLPKDSYLNMNNIIQAACSTGCDAIHPGFGFLSENAMFARLVQACGLIFIGPNPQVIEKMGNKTEARKTMIQAGVPVVKGSKDVLQDVNQCREVSKVIGYPVMIKACNGGGGKGMRIVHREEELDELYATAKQEAKACFGNDDMYVEKYVEHPKHVEIQVAADQFGNVIHLYDRDCSFQIRNQKMIEEAPCFILDEKIRQAMCKDAIEACRSVGYDSVGTIEFLLDKYGNYYFMEMNTRIQVEHPITEMITGIDLVKLQIRIASGLELGMKQEDVKCNGYALECRINAQNPKKEFAPDAGKIEFLNLPGGRGVRIDGAIYNGYVVNPFYDAMLCKIITFAPTRLECIKKMRIALEEFIAQGICTNEEFHYMVLHHREFIEGSYDTSFASKCMKEFIANGNI